MPLLIFAFLLLTLLPAAAQEFPTGVVRIVVPFPAGGGLDNMARPLAERLSKLWNQTVIVENKPGANGQLGGKSVATAPPDGHTLLLPDGSVITSNPFLYKTSSLDPIKELAPVTQLIDLHQFVLVHPSVNARSMNELVALAKSMPEGSLTYGSYGHGSPPHLLYGMLNYQAGTKIRQIPYRGIAAAITATLTGEVHTTLGSLSVAAGHIDSEKLAPLAIYSKNRLPSRPNVPTLIEAGYPDIDPRAWYALFAPVGTPAAIINRIQKDVQTVVNEPEFKARHVDGMGYTGVVSTPSQFAAFIQNDYKLKEVMIKAAGIVPE
ncbi:MAG: tripartite tricarboxylate transporter substrate binding protein [Xanthobacteraceae bacterium]|nr:tripartite tricarboxylate transporter substrate binding protein [Xanthobacteraceae bacterium]